VRLAAALAVALAVSSSLGAHIDQAARRASFSGEVAVAKHGRIVFARGYGQADRARGTPITLDTAFNLASIGKTFTGVAAAQLVQAGKLRFSDPVARYVRLPPPWRHITVAQVLDHTSGLGDFFSDRGYDPARMTSLASYLPLIVKEQPLFPAGQKWSYSNSGFLLAGLVIEKVSGESYAAYLRQHVWRPAGMTHTGCFDRYALPAYAAIGYLPGGLPNTGGLAPTGTSAGGCYSSARDLIRFATALENGRLLSRALVRTITTPKVRAPGGGYGYGFGIRSTTVWHNGGAPGSAGELDINPKLGIVVVTLGNVGPPQVFPVVDAVLNASNVP
jgi:CubicO group peptidase (beta-lactamase class C family)